MRDVSPAELLFRLTDEEARQDIYYWLVRKEAISASDTKHLVEIKGHASDLANGLYMAITRGSLEHLDDVLYAARSILRIYDDSDLKYRLDDYNKKRLAEYKESEENWKHLVERIDKERADE